MTPDPDALDLAAAAIAAENGREVFEMSVDNGIRITTIRGTLAQGTRMRDVAAAHGVTVTSHDRYTATCQPTEKRHLHLLLDTGDRDTAVALSGVLIALSSALAGDDLDDDLAVLVGPAVRAAQDAGAVTLEDIAELQSYEHRFTPRGRDGFLAVSSAVITAADQLRARGLFGSPVPATPASDLLATLLTDLAGPAPRSTTYGGSVSTVGLTRPDLVAVAVAVEPSARHVVVPSRIGAPSWTR